MFDNRERRKKDYEEILALFENSTEHRDINLIPRSLDGDNMRLSLLNIIGELSALKE